MPYAKCPCVATFGFKCEVCKERRERAYAAGRRHKEKDREAYRIKSRQWKRNERVNNPEGVKKRKRAYYAANTEHVRAKAKAFRDANPEKCAQYRETARATGKSGWSKRKHETGHTREYFEAQLATQQQACAICARKFAEIAIKKSTHADHDHANGQPRGVLCNRCNVNLSTLEGPLFQRMMRYLDEWKAAHACLT